MGRHKRYQDTGQVVSAFFSSVSDAYRHPGVGEASEDGNKSISLLAEEFGVSRLKIRKILITTGDLVYSETGRIQALLVDGMKKQEACDQLHIAISTLNSFLPYERGVYNLAEVSNYAENCRVYRERKEAVRQLQADPSTYNLWRSICLFQGYPFATSGHGTRPGVKFKYTVSASSGAAGKHYAGSDVEGFGNELFIITKTGERREKSISRSSADYALQIALESRIRGEVITGPKKLKIYGASYVFSLFRRFGLV